ncbi:hypothetical protein PR048_024499 [Dryococelus australis]|uniref:Uncharacterized protein n=1 Tax=Dryococelus australis TaxID=614101 RepID=A0ABQ9GNT3_9NEOP|nr:hypothetical protein PR048_024499 [Dryococelus australis]
MRAFLFVFLRTSTSEPLSSLITFFLALENDNVRSLENHQLSLSGRIKRALFSVVAQWVLKAQNKIPQKLLTRTQELRMLCFGKTMTNMMTANNALGVRSGEMRWTWSSVGVQGWRETRDPRKKSTDQRNHPARFPRVKTRSDTPQIKPSSPRWEVTTLATASLTFHHLKLWPCSLQSPSLRDRTLQLLDSLHLASVTLILNESACCPQKQLANDEKVENGFLLTLENGHLLWTLASVHLHLISGNVHLHLISGNVHLHLISGNVHLHLSWTFENAYFQQTFANVHWHLIVENSQENGHLPVMLENGHLPAMLENGHLHQTRQNADSGSGRAHLTWESGHLLLICGNERLH